MHPLPLPPLQIAKFLGTTIDLEVRPLISLSDFTRLAAVGWDFKSVFVTPLHQLGRACYTQQANQLPGTDALRNFVAPFLDPEHLSNPTQAFSFNQLVRLILATINHLNETHVHSRQAFLNTLLTLLGERDQHLPNSRFNSIDRAVALDVFTLISDNEALILESNRPFASQFGRHWVNIGRSSAQAFLTQDPVITNELSVFFEQHNPDLINRTLDDPLIAYGCVSMAGHLISELPRNMQTNASVLLKALKDDDLELDNGAVEQVLEGNPLADDEAFMLKASCVHPALLDFASNRLKNDYAFIDAVMEKARQPLLAEQLGIEVTDNATRLSWLQFRHPSFDDAL